MSIDPISIGLGSIEEAIENGSLVFNEKTKKSDFNRACDHILILLEDSLNCFERGSWGTSVFLSLTAIEEVAKASIGIYRRSGKLQEVKRSKDKLFDHLEKHRMAVLPTVFMSKRLEDALGKERCAELLNEAAHGQFRNLRESAIYFTNTSGQFVTPANVINRERARELLLLALETTDDRLVGYTGHTGLIEHRIDQIFLLLAKS